ncbi:hypothetical protein ACFSE1_09070 [Rhizobium helianthi]|uniref:Nodulation protein NopA n=1 Tax=Rhizobium helianthi TaxID=1132695 RepID=A0ABW4M2G9_9HYPH
MASSSGGSPAGGSGSGSVDSAIAEYKKAQEESSAQSMRVATEVTRINGVFNAIKKISPS